MALHPEAEFMFTSESVNEGHPDKLADQVRAHCAHPFVPHRDLPSGLPLAEFRRLIRLVAPRGAAERSCFSPHFFLRTVALFSPPPRSWAHHRRSAAAVDQRCTSFLSRSLTWPCTIGRAAR